VVAEPVRGLAEGKQGSDAAPPPFKDTLALLWSRPSFRHLSIACGLHAFITYGAGNFLPSLFLRLHEISTGELGTWLALASVSGGAGTFLGGYLSDKLAVRDQRWYQWVPAATTIVTIPFTLFIYTTDQTYLALALNFVPAIFFAAYLAPNIAVTHSLVGLRMRALSSAILFFVLNLVGLGGGPRAPLRPRVHSLRHGVRDSCGLRLEHGALPHCGEARPRRSRSGPCLGGPA
jgi:predicted MFS family arabinose efflux permease